MHRHRQRTVNRVEGGGMGGLLPAVVVEVGVDDHAGAVCVFMYKRCVREGEGAVRGGLTHAYIVKGV